MASGAGGAAVTTSGRLGVLGGTFDPPHLGHLLLGEVARQELGLGRVLFAPAGEPPHKPGRGISAAGHRLEMVRLAIADNPFFALEMTDMERPPPHYTYTLLPLLQQRYRGAELWLLVGGDSIRDFATWREPQQVMAYGRLAVLPRPGATIDWEAVERLTPGIVEATTLLKGPALDIRGTTIRSWVEKGRSVRYLVSEAVRDYIQRQGLYSNGH